MSTKKISKLLLFMLTMIFIFSMKTQSETFKSSSSLDSNSPPTSNQSTYIPLFDETSITREYLNKHTGLKWKNHLGDWVDKIGIFQGNNPWATVKVSRDKKGPIVLDVTDLAKRQQGKKDQLMIFSATVPVAIASKESGHSPLLKLLFEDGKILEKKPNFDCHIARSTFKNINTDILKFDSKDRKAFIQFEVPKGKLKKATLEIWPIKIFGSGMINVFNLAPQKRHLFTLKKGIAEGYSSFSALEGHPDVIFVDTFESPKIKKEWFWQKKLRNDQVVNGYLTGGIDPIRKNNSAFNLRYFFAKNSTKEEPEEIFFRYSIKFHKDFVYATQGGKLPGQSGTYNTCGWGGRKPSDTCLGWSARMQFKPPIKVGPYRNMIPIGTYLYHLDQEGPYGDYEKWQAVCNLEQWCELEQYVKLNTPGKNNGILRGYQNGKVVYERKDIRFRDHDSLRIEDVWLLVYHGGTGLPIKPIHVDIDNVVISKSYIGMPNKI